MKKQKTICLLPFILITALLAGCATTLPDNAVLTRGPSVTYEQAITLARPDNMDDPFNKVAANYLAANPKPPLPEEARKYWVQAEFVVKEKKFDLAAEFYAQTMEIAPWWPQGHFNQAVIFAELKKYREAMGEMKRYLQLAPDAPDARAAQDQIYQWEVVAPLEVVEFRDCRDCPVMVALGNKFAIGKYEVTQAQWQAVMGKNPSDFKSANRPVEEVSWDDAQEYIKKLNQKTGKQYRLPTETEWVFACYGGSQTEYCGSEDVNAVAWYYSNSAQQTHSVGQKQANGYGLHDMSGNVWEWMDDCWQDDCPRRVERGGSWNDIAENVRLEDRDWDGTTLRSNDMGFRLGRTLP